MSIFVGYVCARAYVRTYVHASEGKNHYVSSLVRIATYIRTYVHTFIHTYVHTYVHTLDVWHVSIDLLTLLELVYTYVRTSVV